MEEVGVKEPLGTTQADDILEAQTASVDGKPPKKPEITPEWVIEKIFEWSPLIAIALLAFVCVATSLAFNDQRMAMDELCGKLCKCQGLDQGRMNASACVCWNPWDQTKPFDPYISTPPAPPVPTAPRG